MTTACTGCGSVTCKPAAWHLCPSCKGEGCGECRESLVPGIIPGWVDNDVGSNIIVCSEFEDPAVDALAAGTLDSLLAAVRGARDAAIDEEEAHDVV
jgi:hypothetical protein